MIHFLSQWALIGFCILIVTPVVDIVKKLNKVGQVMLMILLGPLCWLILILGLMFFKREKTV